MFRIVDRKVPEITIFFWTLKLLSTAMGESVSDFLVHQIDPVIAVMIGGVGLFLALGMQFFVSRYNVWIYWFAVCMVAVFGTMAADVLHVGLGIPYSISTSVFFITLIFIFFLWHHVERTLSIHSITTTRREMFYWMTVLATFALGTAAGDMSATTLGFGYFESGVVFTLLFFIPGIAYWKWNVYPIACFWIAYILTRPLGASFADWTGRSPDLGGIGLGTGHVSIILIVLILLFVLYLSVTKKDKQKR